MGDDKVELSLALLTEADDEGEDREFREVLGKAVKAVGGRGAKYLDELHDLLHLPPRVALWRLMSRDEWREAFKQASARFVSVKLRHDELSGRVDVGEGL